MNSNNENMSSMHEIRRLVQSQLRLSPFRITTKSNCNSSPVIKEYKAEEEHQSLETEFRNIGINEIRSEEEENKKNQLLNMDNEYNELFSELCSSMNGDGNRSLIIYGCHGSGKSSLMFHTLHNLRLKYGFSSFTTIYLNGYLHTNDTQSMFAIVQQLPNTQAIQQSFIKNKNQFEQNLEYLVSILKGSMTSNIHSKSKPIFIILDNFDLFALRKQTKQTLIYNLYELLNDGNTALNIIGLTNKNSIQHLLEKRIRSRMIHKKIFVPNRRQSFAKYYSILYQILLIPNNHPDIQLYNEWISDHILDNKIFEDYVQKLYKIGCANNYLFTISLILSYILFQPKYYLLEFGIQELIEDEIIVEIENCLFCEPLLLMINDLSVNELFIVIIACKLDLNTYPNVCVFNFEILFDAMCALMKGRSSCSGVSVGRVMQNMNKNIYHRYFLSLCRLKFFVSVGGNGVFDGGNTFYLMVKLNGIEGKKILKYVEKEIKDCPTWITEWLITTDARIV